MVNMIILSFGILLLLSLNTKSAEATYVDLINYVNDSIIVHCQSKDTDLGSRVVQPEMNYFWTFRPNIFGMTLYWCDFFWLKKKQTIQVWKGSYYSARPPCAITGACTYKVAPEGFYWAVVGAETQASAWAFLTEWQAN